MKVAIFSDVHGKSSRWMRCWLMSRRKAWMNAGWSATSWRSGRIRWAASRLSALPNARFVRGNSDRYTLRGDLPSVAPAPDDPSPRTRFAG